MRNEHLAKSGDLSRRPNIAVRDGPNLGVRLRRQHWHLSQSGSRAALAAYREMAAEALALHGGAIAQASGDITPIDGTSDIIVLG